MTGTEVLKKILAFIKENNDIWKRACVDDFDIDDMPDREWEYGGLSFSWSENLGPLFCNDLSFSNYEFKVLYKSNCCFDEQGWISFNEGMDIRGFLCNDYLAYEISEDYSYFFINNLDKVLDITKINNNVHLDDIIINLPFLGYLSEYKEDIEFEALKLGYLLDEHENHKWKFKNTICSGSNEIKKANDNGLVKMLRSAVQNADIYYQYLDLYHIIEYRYYDATLAHITSLKQSSPSDFIRKIKSSKDIYNEQNMFIYVIDHLTTGFSYQLDIDGIRGEYTLDTDGNCKLEKNFCKSNNSFLKLEISNKKSWCFLLYQIRCGIVHTKEDETVFERTDLHKKILKKYLLPYLINLSIFLIQN